MGRVPHLSVAEVVEGLAALGARVRWDGPDLLVLVPKGRVPKRKPPCLQHKNLWLLKMMLILNSQAAMRARLYDQRYRLLTWCTSCAREYYRDPWVEDLRCPQCSYAEEDDPVIKEMIRRIGAKHKGRVPEMGSWWAHQGDR